MVRRFSIKRLVFLLLCCLSITLLAEEIDEIAVDNVASSEESVFPNIRQEAYAEGYQLLTVAGQEVDTAYIEERLGQQYGAIVLLHDNGGGLASQGVIEPLRHYLPDYGWSTLSLALDYPYTPNIYLALEAGSDLVPETDGEMDSEKVTQQISGITPSTDVEEKDILPLISNRQRIEAAVAFLYTQNNENIIILAHGAGGEVAVQALDSKTMPPVVGLILVGSTELNSANKEVFKTFQFPILDIVGGNDSYAVEGAQDRKVMMKRTGNTLYAKRNIASADHDFSGLDQPLVTTVKGWLRKVFVEQVDM